MGILPHSKFNVTRYQNSEECPAINEIVKETMIRLHLRFNHDKKKDLSIQYKDEPFLKQLPGNKTILTREAREKVQPWPSANYSVSVALFTDSLKEIPLVDNNERHPLCTYYIRSKIEKFDMEYPCCILSFNYSPSDIIKPRPDFMILQVSVIPKGGNVRYQGDINVNFRVTI